ncbi:MAG TPA: hypothetical protein GX523_07270, partial [Desulfitobacterium dehalogenans]|nr:hypothetical protein [Desulfitobacterium dehalogenans]
MRQGVFRGNQSFFVQGQQACVHADHSVICRGVDRRIDLMGFGVPDHGPDRVIAQHNLECGDKGALRRRDQLLGYDRLQHHGKLDPHLPLLIGR